MIIDTKEEALTFRNTKAFAVIAFSVLIVVTVVFSPFDQMLKNIIYGALSVAFLVFYWFQYQMHYTYFYFSDNSKNLVFRFYSLRFFSGKPRSIEISKTSFLKYDIETSFFNKKDSLVLYQKTDKGVAKYPPISLTLLSKKQKTELKRTLFSITHS